MKIGILTFHCAHNYGAVLQAYATQEYLKNNGYDACIIDYRPEYLTRGYRKSLPLNIKEISIPCFIRNLALEPFVGPYLKRRYNRFDDFIREHLNLARYKDASLKEYDAVILGSDQIWSPNLTGGKFDDNYFASKAECKIISYAASCNLTTFSEKDRNYLSHKLSRFHSISVRENSLNHNLSEFISTKVFTVVDPTLLAGRVAFDKLIDNYSHNTEDYVLCFELNPYHEVREISKDIARQLHCKVKFLSGYPYQNRIFNSQTDLSPSDMLKLVRDAKCVVTSSFHACAFSLLFERPFYVVRKGNGGDARFVSMLENFGIPERVINKSDRPHFREFNYTEVKKSMSSLIIGSQDFLKHSLKY